VYGGDAVGWRRRKSEARSVGDRADGGNVPTGLTVAPAKTGISDFTAGTSEEARCWKSET
jgi:hypothetical protein